MCKYIVGLLCSILPLIAMGSSITDEEYLRVEKTIFSIFQIQQREFDPLSNPIAALANTMKNDFIKADRSFNSLIEKEELQARLDRYKEVDSNEIIQCALKQVKASSTDNLRVSEYITQTRCILSGLELQKMQPVFSPAKINELKDTDGWIAFMQRNWLYPCSDLKAARDYIALFIYQEILSKRIE